MAFQKNMRVLIVDDTSTSRMLIRDALEQLGMTQIASANDGEEALKAMVASPSHLGKQVAISRNAVADRCQQRRLRQPAPQQGGDDPPPAPQRASLAASLPDGHRSFRGRQPG